MNCRIGPFFSFLIFILLSFPTFAGAQANREGNHCGVTRSPYRVAMDSGKSVYVKQCVSCHQADGLGALNYAPPLNGKAVTGDKKRLIEILAGSHASREEPENKTPQYVKSLNPEMEDLEIADVLTYIRNSFGNKASAVKVSEVKSVRSN